MTPLSCHCPASGHPDASLLLSRDGEIAFWFVHIVDRNDQITFSSRHIVNRIDQIAFSSRHIVNKHDQIAFSSRQIVNKHGQIAFSSRHIVNRDDQIAFWSCHITNEHDQIAFSSRSFGDRRTEGSRKRPRSLPKPATSARFELVAVGLPDLAGARYSQGGSVRAWVPADLARP
jgi:hypothetical protein